jgi:hypothetical protein
LQIVEPLLCLHRAEVEGASIPKARRLSIGDHSMRAAERQKGWVEGFAYPDRGLCVSSVDGLLVIKPCH